jgi:hypothetical protein
MLMMWWRQLALTITISQHRPTGSPYLESFV